MRPVVVDGYCLQGLAVGLSALAGRLEAETVGLDAAVRTPGVARAAAVGAAFRLRTAADLSHEPVGIPFFWRIDFVDEGEPRLQAYALATKGTYVQEAELGPLESGTLEHPWPTTIDMADFVLPGG